MYHLNTVYLINTNPPIEYTSQKYRIRNEISIKQYVKVNFNFHYNSKSDIGNLIFI